jgi:hypothetical protein
MRDEAAAAKPRKTTCRACGADIFFAVHAFTGELAPINLEPDPQGELMLVAPQTGRPAYPCYRHHAPLFDPRPDQFYTSHYATCPEAERFRKGAQP